MEGSTSSFEYKGSIADAINAARTEKKLFVVCISGETYLLSPFLKTILFLQVLLKCFMCIVIYVFYLCCFLLMYKNT